MIIEMTFDLSFGLDDEAEASPVTQECRGGAESEGAGVPQRVQQARLRPELPETRLAPGEMIGLRARGCQKQLACGLRAGDKSLAVVEGLCGELAGVVDAHERSARTSLAVGKWARGRGGLWGGSAGVGRRKNCAQSPIESGDHRVE